LIMLAERGEMEGMRLAELMRSRRLWPLTLAQSCGAVNDNLVKNAMIVLAIFRLGTGGAGLNGAGLSALAGALFIAPYILLSASAGMLADRFAKPRLVVAYKAMEVVLMLLAAAALVSASVPALLAVLAGLGVQAALFGPVKYGVLPEYLTGPELHRRRWRAGPAGLWGVGGWHPWD
jgi:MFS family permease